MSLKWSMGEGRVLTAIGLHGKYTVTPANNAWWLEGRGHDGLLMIALPVRGRPFLTQDAARVEAQRLDNARVVEAELSGC